MKLLGSAGPNQPMATVNVRSGTWWQKRARSEHATCSRASAQSRCSAFAVLQRQSRCAPLGYAVLGPHDGEPALAKCIGGLQR